MYENLISGLVSGLIVTVFVVIFRQIWNSVIVPWFEERVYKDVHIEGKWFGLYPGSVDLRRDVIVLKRHGHEVHGTLTCTVGDDEGDEYSLVGSFRNLILPLIYESTERGKTDRGTITLKCMKNGQMLVGEIAFYRNSKDVIESGNITWFRKKEELEATIKRIESHRERIAELKAERDKINAEEAEIELGELIESKNEDSEPANKALKAD